MRDHGEPPRASERRPIPRLSARLLLAGWVAPLGLLSLGLLLSLLVLSPGLAPRLDPTGVAWASALFVLGMAFGYLLAHHGALQRGALRDRHIKGAWPGHEDHGVAYLRGRLPHWYKGRSHSGERPRYD